MSLKYNKVLTIAGSDSGGCAGIQADLKAISACGCFGMTALTATTAQNTVGVTDVHGIPPDHLQKQITAVLQDIGADAIKIGMLHSPEIITVVQHALISFSVKNVVLDPVMVATSGDTLLQENAIASLKEILPLARLITPNIPEAALLSGEQISTLAEMKEVAKHLAKTYGVSVLLKAGHLEEDVLTDVLYNIETDATVMLSAKKIVTSNTHGTGCTLSSAIAAFLAKGKPLEEAVTLGKEYLLGALQAGATYTLGTGHGPVHHFYQHWT